MRWPRAVALLATGWLLTGCAGMDFVQNDVIAVRTPQDGSHVRLPVVIRWDLHGAPTDRVAVYVDRTPVAPGDVIDVAGNPIAGIPATEVHSDGQITLSRLTPNAGADAAERQHHEVTLVLVGGDGRRVGEESGFVTFRVDGQ